MDEFKKLREEEEKTKKERARKKRIRRRNRKVISAIFLILVIALAGFIFIRTPLFNIENVEMSGNNLVSTEEILKASGIVTGENIFDYNVKEISQKIFLVPYISEVTVKKKYPSAISVEVKEEKEFAVLRFYDSLISCDKNGKSIKVINEELAEKLISVSGIAKGEFVLGDYVKLSDEVKTELLTKCFSIINEYEFNNVTEIKLADKYDIQFVLASGRIIKIGELGDENEISYKMSYIKEVMKKLPQDAGGIIDARYSDVTYRPGDYKYGSKKPIVENTEKNEQVENSEITAEEGET